MGNIMDISAAGKSCRHHALKYAAMGWHVFPIWGATDGACDCGEPECKSPGKHPISHLVPRGMNDASCNPDAIRVWFDKAPNANIGINLVRSGLVAVDVDPRNGGHLTMELIEADASRPIASDVLAFTQGGGEHRFFNLPQDAGIQLPGTLGKGVDLKRNGYVVAAPSCGVQGCYDWEASSNPLDGAIPTPLPDWIRGLSAPSSAAPTKAQMESVGYSTVTKAQVAELRLALEHITDCDDRDTWLRVIGALRGLGSVGWELAEEWSKRSEKYDPADQAKKWYETRGWARIEYQTVFHMAMERGWENQVIVPAVAYNEAPKATKPPSQEPKAVPMALIDSLPAPLKDGYDWVMKCAASPQPEYALLSMLGLASVVLGRRYVTSYGAHSSMYFLGLGRSGSGKDQIDRGIKYALEAAGLSQLVGNATLTNDSSVYGALKQKPACVLTLDEFGLILQAGNNAGNTMAIERKAILLRAFSSCDTALYPKGYADAARLEPEETPIQSPIRRPALTLMCMSTPQSVFEHLGPESLQDGFANRFLVLSCPGRRSDSLPKGSWDNPPASLVQWLRDMSSRGRPQKAEQSEGEAAADLITPRYDCEPNLTRVGERPDAHAAREAHWRLCNERARVLEADNLSEMWMRATDLVGRLSLIMAKASGSSYVEKDHVDWAVKLVDHCQTELLIAVSLNMGGSLQKFRNAVLKKVASSGDDGVLPSVIKNMRIYKTLEERNHNLPERVLKGMVDDGVIVLREPPANPDAGGMGAAKKKRYIAVGSYGEE